MTEKKHKDLVEIFMLEDNYTTEKPFNSYFTLTDHKTIVKVEPVFKPIIINMAGVKDIKKEIESHNPLNIADHYLVGDPIKIVNNKRYLDLRSVQYYKRYFDLSKPF